MVERYNRTLAMMLAMFVSENKDDWDDHLSYLCMAYRACIHDSTKCSPNLLMLGREISLPIDVMTGNSICTIELNCPNIYIEWLIMSTEEPLNIMTEDEIFDKEKLIEFYYSTDMRCPIADCDFGGRFLTKTKYSRHWEERHISSVQKYEYPIQYCRGVLRRRSDMKSHIKFVHGEKNDTRIEEITLKSRKIVEHSKNFINPGFFCI
ncbi:unnamed protein product [Mytilus coruscus]|uniref:Uncharacterized protein n=1 Tax=Mytilus coruscus TaxID=42192 RepID=A0A6J7ZX48_MYTCO|nr:unnamed protein product [Mytilus coruscus]